VESFLKCRTESSLVLPFPILLTEKICHKSLTTFYEAELEFGNPCGATSQKSFWLSRESLSFSKACFLQQGFPLTMAILQPLGPVMPPLPGSVWQPSSGSKAALPMVTSVGVASREGCVRRGSTSLLHPSGLQALAETSYTIHHSEPSVWDGRLHSWRKINKCSGKMQVLC
jgi:hypothetical protein